jgi:hypothetical protein
VVELGTARGLKPALARPSGGSHTVSGKTGTGDHRYFVYAKNGSVVASRVVSRAATFTFLLDDRYFGTVTAYVPGSEAARFHFTSALPVRILGHLLPTLDLQTLDRRARRGPEHPGARNRRPDLDREGLPIAFVDDVEGPKPATVGHVPGPGDRSASKSPSAQAGRPPHSTSRRRR